MTRPLAYVLYTAVLPAYRRSCLELVQERLGETWSAFAGPTHLDQTVSTDVPKHLYVPVANHRWLGGRLLFQWGHWREALAATTAVLDLNPRSVSAWFLLLARKALRRRTLLWGQLDPRRGVGSPTARLRAVMRDLADGCIVYTYDSARRLRAANPAARVWVAPNALYPTQLLQLAERRDRRVVLYVGRLEPAKKPGLLLDAFASLAAARPEWNLVMVGEGSLRPELAAHATSMGLADRVCFPGAITDACGLADLYAQAHCSVSPGPVGLTLTQSLGFGVPMVIADGEAHGPEIELAQPGAAVFFERDSAASLAQTLTSTALLLNTSERTTLVETVRSRYSAEAMAQGLVEAVTDVAQEGTP